MRLLTFVIFMAATSLAQAACEFDVEVGDALSFNVDSIEVEAGCDAVTINLTHTGQLPAAAMGHNWVLTTEADFQPVASAGISAGLPGNYLPADDARIIAATKIIGGGESTSIEFSISDLGADGEYTFFCSFPGHWSVMKGAFKIV